MKSVLDDPRDCTGCGACAAVCGSDAISLLPDPEGFQFPSIDPALCTDCGLCRRTCPSAPERPLSQELSDPLAVMAAWNLDDKIRSRSSSGGVFTALALQVLEQGGAVVGAAMDDSLQVVHVLVEDPDGLERLRGSKYVQSRVPTELLQNIRSRLKGGQPILFTGTPCQVAGLRRFLRNLPPHLFLCDIVCHGTPSPLLWRAHIEETARKGKKVVQASFRDKSRGWSRSGPLVRHVFADGTTETVPGQSSPYVVAFLRDCALREACYTCPYTSPRRTGDVTLADFWGVRDFHPDLDPHDQGTSLLFVGSEKGRKLLEDAGSRLFSSPSRLECALPRNPMLTHPSHRPPERDRFYADLVTLGYAKMVRRHHLSISPFERRIRDFAKRLKARLRRLAVKTRRSGGVQGHG